MDLMPGGFASRFKRSAAVTRFLTGVVPLGLIVLIAMAGFIYFVPAARDQARESLTRESDPYVELYFSDALAARACPTRSKGRRAFIDARVRDSAARSGAIPYVVTVRAAKGETSVRGTASLAESGVGRVERLIRIPRASRRYVIEVTIPGREPLLRIRCAPRGNP